MKIRTNSNKQSSFVLKGVHPKQMEAIKTGRMPLGVFIGLLGGSAGTMGFGYVHDQLATMEEPEDDSDFEDGEIVDDSESCDYEVPTTVEFSEKVSDDMSFGEAYATAREEMGQGGFFQWKGQYYHTYSKEEWDSFTDDDKTEFFEMFRQNSDFENAEERDPDPEAEPDTYNEPEPEHEEEPKPNETDEEDEEMVELEEIGTDEEIIEGLNDGDAYEEEDNYGEDIT